MVDCIYNFKVCNLNFYVYHQQKKSVTSDQIYRKDAQWYETDILVHELLFFCDIYFLDMIDFDIFGEVEGL